MNSTEFPLNLEMIRQRLLPIAATAAPLRQEAAAAALPRRTLNGELTLIHARLSGRLVPRSALTHPVAPIHMFTLVWGAARPLETDRWQQNKHAAARICLWGNLWFATVWEKEVRD